MEILISNDDGIGSEGLLALANAVEPLGNVWVVAPDRERSAVSQAISLNRPLRVKKQKERWFSVDGTPVDCIYLALAKLLPTSPSLVLSGINLGANLGQDVFYSGTVAAAIEAVIDGIPAVALSLDILNLKKEGINLTKGLEVSANFSYKIAKLVLENGLPKHSLLNVNIPAKCKDDTIEITKLGQRHYGKEVIERKDPRGRRYYWIGGVRVDYEDIAQSDCNALIAGRISVSPLRLDLSDNTLRQTLSGWDL